MRYKKGWALRLLGKYEDRSPPSGRASPLATLRLIGPLFSFDWAGRARPRAGETDVGEERSEIHSGQVASRIFLQRPFDRRRRSRRSGQGRPARKMMARRFRTPGLSWATVSPCVGRENSLLASILGELGRSSEHRAVRRRTSRSGGPGRERPLPPNFDLPRRDPQGLIYVDPARLLRANSGRSLRTCRTGQFDPLLSLEPKKRRAS